jgi:versiconal hemiacetal acetate esterase
MHGTPDEMKAMYAQLVAMLFPNMPPRSEGIEVKEGDVEGVKYRMYIPKEAAKSGPLPVGIW